MPRPSPIRPERIRSIVAAAKEAGAARVRIGPDGEVTVEHVRAITGHTGARMATHYSMKAAQRARAKEVQEKRK